MPFDVIVMGSAGMDVFVKTAAKIIQIEGMDHGHAVLERLLAYPLGSKLLIEKLVFHPGGAGTNVCATLSRLGFHIAFVGKLGTDTHGQVLLDWLQTNHVTFLGEKGGETGYSLILTSQADDRTILSFKGCNNELEFQHLPTGRLQAHWLYGTSMLDNSFLAQKQLFALAHRTGMRTAYNPNPYICSQGLAYIQDILDYTDVLILNREEANLLMGKGETIDLARRLANHGPSIVAISDGAKGVSVFANNPWGNGGWRILPASGIKVVETTGAGDAFGAGLVAGLLLDKPCKEAALMGVLNAEEVIKAYGAKQHLIDRTGLEAQLRAELANPQHEIHNLI
jgi:ribokinase